MFANGEGTGVALFSLPLAKDSLTITTDRELW